MLVVAILCTFAFRTSGQQCTLFKNTDFNGNDISANKSSTPEECCAKCATTKGCTVFTWMPDSDTCYLKSSAKGMRTMYVWWVCGSVPFCRGSFPFPSFKGSDALTVCPDDDAEGRTSLAASMQTLNHCWPEGHRCQHHSNRQAAGRRIHVLHHCRRPHPHPHRLR